MIETAGMLAAVISISIVVSLAHCPGSGVNVYVVLPGLFVLITPGVHVPVIPSMLMFGSTGAIEPSQIDAMLLNVGITRSVMLTVVVHSVVAPQLLLIIQRIVETPGLN